MTFAEFKASKEFKTDLRPDIPWELPEEIYTKPVPGNLYMDTYYIIKYSATKWYLILGNMEYIEEDLYVLEHLLYNFTK